jgi:hypothetical protein
MASLGRKEETHTKARAERATGGLGPGQSPRLNFGESSFIRSIIDISRKLLLFYTSIVVLFRANQYIFCAIDRYFRLEFAGWQYEPSSFLGGIPPNPPGSFRSTFVSLRLAR